LNDLMEKLDKEKLKENCEYKNWKKKYESNLKNESELKVKEMEKKYLNNILSEIILPENTEELEELYTMKMNIDKINKEINEKNEELGSIKMILKNIDDKLITLKNKKDEYKKVEKDYKLYSIMDDLMGKNGLSLYLLNHYLPIIENSVNNIIRPYIDKKIKLYIDGDNVIMESYVDNNKIVNLFGGMESVILDLSFKMVFSQIAILPKCDLLIIDECLSFFDNKRIENIDKLFDFIKCNFDKVIIISHIDNIKENINYQIDIEKNSKKQSLIKIV